LKLKILYISYDGVIDHQSEIHRRSTPGAKFCGAL
jgi:hypothetical protein